MDADLESKADAYPRMVELIDPPMGGKFGFPKVFDGVEGVDLGTWLVASGYPQRLVDLYPGGVPARILQCRDDHLWRFRLSGKPIR